MIEDFAHISVGAKLGGNVHIGKRTWIGIGGVVVKDIEESDIYAGVLIKCLRAKRSIHK